MLGIGVKGRIRKAPEGAVICQLVKITVSVGAPVLGSASSKTASYLKQLILAEVHII